MKNQQGRQGKLLTLPFIKHKIQFNCDGLHFKNINLNFYSLVDLYLPTSLNNFN